MCISIFYDDDGAGGGGDFSFRDPILRLILQNIFCVESSAVIWIHFASEEISVIPLVPPFSGEVSSASFQRSSLKSGRAHFGCLSELHFHVESVTTPSLNEPIIEARGMPVAAMATTRVELGIAKLIAWV